jgi:hypothetical protein
MHLGQFWGLRHNVGNGGNGEVVVVAVAAEVVAAAAIAAVLAALFAPRVDALFTPTKPPMLTGACSRVCALTVDASCLLTTSW